MLTDFSLESFFLFISNETPKSYIYGKLNLLAFEKSKKKY